MESMLKEKVMKTEGQLFEHMPCSVLTCENDQEFHIDRLNNEFLKMTGYTEREISLKFQSSLLKMVCPDDRSYVEATVREQLQQQSSEATLEYRIVKADGETCWVLDKRRLLPASEGTCLCCCVLVDTTVQKQENEQLRLNLERYKIITDQSTDIIFEWDFAQDSVYFSPNWKKKFGYSPIQENITFKLMEEGHIFPQDKIRLKFAMKKVKEGTSFREVEVRISDSSGLYTWCRIRASTQYDENGTPIRAVGIVTDISEDKAQRQQLLEQAQRDSLTGLLNKTATERQVSAYLAKAEDTSCALMILDLDHFKSINDRFGHLCGDAVLTDTSEAIQHMFRVSDIMGRIGGDEFLVFVPEIDREAAMKKAHQLLQKLEHICLDDGVQHMSCSIGISFYPEDAESFSDLYRFADRALYQVKRSGRADAALYSEDCCCQQVQETVGEREERRSFHSEHLYADSSQMLQEVFRLLSSTPAIPVALNHVLESLSRWFHVTHACIWEYQPLQRAYRAAFEWDERELPDPQQKNVLWYSGMDVVLNAVGPDTLFCCEDINGLDTEQGHQLKKRGVYSLMECVMTDSGQRVGLLSCESHRKFCRWTQEQKNAFRQITDLLAVYLTKYQQQQKLEQLQKK